MPLPAALPLRPSPTRPDWTGIARAVALVVVMCACYRQTLDGGFFWDDHFFLPADPAEQSLTGLRDLWFSPHTADYYPLTSTAFWLEWHLWGHDPFGYHVVNLALGLANVFLFWTLLKLLRLPGAWFAALLFALHPLNVASVAWIAETKNTLSTAFYLLCLLLYVRADSAPPGRGRLLGFTAAFCAFVLAALSKSSVVMLPGVLLLYAWWRRGTIRRADAWRSLPFFAVSLAAGLLTIWFHHHRAMNGTDPQFAVPSGTRLLMAGHALLFYLGRALVPVRLSMVYPPWQVPGLPWSILPLVLVATLGAVLWRARARWGCGPVACYAYFVGSLLPVSGLLAASLFHDSDVFDHLTYVAMLGPVAGLAAGLARWQATRGGAVPAWAAMALLAGFFGWGAWDRARDFRSSEALWQSALVVAPASAAAHNNLGIALLDQRRFALAASHFRAALAREPRGTTAAANLGLALQWQGDWPGAAAAYALSLADAPDAATCNNDGVVALELGDADRARARFRWAARLEPRLVGPRFNLYRLAIVRQDFPAAVDELAACLCIDPDDVPSLLALATLDVQAAPPGSTPPAATALAQRACLVADYRDPVSGTILARANAPSPSGTPSARLPGIPERIEGIVKLLPAPRDPRADR